MSVCDEENAYRECRVPLLVHECTELADASLRQRQVSGGSCQAQHITSRGRPQLWQYVLCVVASMLNASVYSLLQIWSAYASALQESYHLDEVQLNDLFSIMNFGACMFSWLPGIVFDLYGPVATGICGGVLACLGLSLCLLQTQQLIGNVGLRVAFFLFGFGATFYNINGVLACLKCFPAERAGAVSAWVLCFLALAMTGHSLVYETFFIADFVAFLWYELACAALAALLAALVFGPLCGHLLDDEDVLETSDQILSVIHTPWTPQRAVSPINVTPIQFKINSASVTSRHHGMVDSCPGTPGTPGRWAHTGKMLHRWFEGVARKAIQGPAGMCRLALPSKPSQHLLQNLARIEGSALDIEEAGPEDEAVRDLRRALRALLVEGQTSKEDSGKEVRGPEASGVLSPPLVQRSRSAPDLLRERNFPGAPTFAEMAQPGAFRREYLESDALGEGVGGPTWAGAPPLTQLLASGHDFWARLSPPLSLMAMFVERGRLLSSPQFIFLTIVFMGPVAWVFSYLGAVAEIGAKLGMQDTQVVRLTEWLGLASAAGRLLLGVSPDFVQCVKHNTFVICSVALMLVGTTSVLVRPSINSLWLCSILVMFGYGGILALVPGCLRAGLGMRYVGFLYGILYFLLGISLVPWSSHAVGNVGCVALDGCYGGWLKVSSACSVGVIVSGLLFICCH